MQICEPWFRVYLALDNLTFQAPSYDFFVYILKGAQQHAVSNPKLPDSNRKLPISVLKSGGSNKLKSGCPLMVPVYNNVYIYKNIHIHTQTYTPNIHTILQSPIATATTCIHALTINFHSTLGSRFRPVKWRGSGTFATLQMFISFHRQML